MKERIKIDSMLLIGIIVVTFILFFCKGLYIRNMFWNNVISFIGLVSILKGVLFRMSARGFKKAHSSQGKQLVTTGPYRYVRNPMYLGSFKVGCGFALMFWPIWLAVFFPGLFLWRFFKQIAVEEIYLEEQYGEEFRRYCQKTPRLFPKYQDLFKMKTQEMVDLQLAFTTKEQNALYICPVSAFILKWIQNAILFERAALGQTLGFFVFTILIFFIVFRIMYNFK